MEDVGVFGALFVPAIITLIIIVYPYLALGRIWYYSKQQVKLLEEIQHALRERPVK